MRGGPRKNAGRKPVEIDVEDWEKLHAMHCSVEEIAGLYSVSTRTIETLYNPAISSTLQCMACSFSQSSTSISTGLRPAFCRVPPRLSSPLSDLASLGRRQNSN